MYETQNQLPVVGVHSNEFKSDDKITYTTLQRFKKV